MVEKFWPSWLKAQTTVASLIGHNKITKTTTTKPCLQKYFKWPCRKCDAMICYVFVQNLCTCGIFMDLLKPDEALGISQRRLCCLDITGTSEVSMAFVAFVSAPAGSNCPTQRRFSAHNRRESKSDRSHSACSRFWSLPSNGESSWCEGTRLPAAHGPNRGLRSRDPRHCLAGGIWQRLSLKNY